MKKRFKWKEIHQSWLLVAGAVGVILGVVLALVLRINYFFSYWWILFALGLLVFAYFKPKIIFIVLALIAGMVVAFFRVSLELTGEKYVEGFWGQTVVVTGVISGDPETEEGMTKLKLSELRFGEEGQASSGSLYVMLAENAELARDDTVKLSGKMTEGFGVYAGCMYKPTLEQWLRPEPGNEIVKIRNWFSERIKSLLPEQEGALGVSYLLGMRNGLDENLNEDLRTVGLVHIVVASGAHLSILVGGVRKVFGKISRFSSLLFSILLVIIFMVMIGWTPSIMRAGAMSILAIVAWFFGRKIQPWRLILLVAAGTLIVNPMFIMHLGWLLSFASFIGIMILGPRITQFLYGEKKPGFLMETVIMTIAATLMTLPITLYYFGQVSLISIIANLLILPTLPIAMGLTFLTGICCGVPGVEIIVAFLTEKILNFHIFVVQTFSEMPMFLVKIETGQIWVFGMYGIIGVLIVLGWWLRKRKGEIRIKDDFDVLRIWQKRNKGDVEEQNR